MFVRVTSGHFFARLTSARLPIQPEFRFSIEVSFLENIWEDQEQIDSFISFLDSTISEDERHEINADVKWENISLLDFARLIVIRKENLKFIEEFDKITVPYESDPVIAEPKQEEIIISTEDTLCRIWGYKRQANLPVSWISTRR